MSEIKYRKLIRDKIPEIIKESGKTPITEIVEGEDLLKLLNYKLNEEIDEYNSSEEVEELVDIVEVVYAILKFKDISLEEFEAIRVEKKDKRGAFDKGIMLKKVIDD